MYVPMQGYVCGVCLLWVCACVLSYLWGGGAVGCVSFSGMCSLVCACFDVCDLWCGCVCALVHMCTCKCVLVCAVEEAERKTREKYKTKMNASIQKKKKDQNTPYTKTRSASNRYPFFSVYVTFGNLFISPSLCVFYFYFKLLLGIFRRCCS